VLEGLAVFCWTIRTEGTSKANNTNEAKAHRKANQREKPSNPKIKNRKGMTQKSQKSRRPRRSRLSLSLARHKIRR
jgi:hypothetical protein